MGAAPPPAALLPGALLGSWRGGGSGVGGGVQCLATAMPPACALASARHGRRPGRAAALGAVMIAYRQKSRGLHASGSGSGNARCGTLLYPARPGGAGCAGTRA